MKLLLLPLLFFSCVTYANDNDVNLDGCLKKMLDLKIYSFLFRSKTRDAASGGRVHYDNMTGALIISGTDPDENKDHIYISTTKGEIEVQPGSMACGNISKDQTIYTRAKAILDSTFKYEMEAGDKGLLKDRLAGGDITQEQLVDFYNDCEKVPQFNKTIQGFRALLSPKTQYKKPELKPDKGSGPALKEG